MNKYADDHGILATVMTRNKNYEAKSGRGEGERHTMRVNYVTKSMFMRKSKK